MVSFSFDYFVACLTMGNCVPIEDHISGCGYRNFYPTNDDVRYIKSNYHKGCDIPFKVNKFDRLEIGKGPQKHVSSSVLD